MKRFTLSELQLANELAWPQDMERLLSLYFPDTWQCYYYDFMHKHERSLIKMIFHYSRADYETDMGEAFENIITDLLPNK